MGSPPWEESLGGEARDLPLEQTVTQFYNMKYISYICHLCLSFVDIIVGRTLSV